MWAGTKGDTACGIPKDNVDPRAVNDLPELHSFHTLVIHFIHSLEAS